MRLPISREKGAGVCSFLLFLVLLFLGSWALAREEKMEQLSVDERLRPEDLGVESQSILPGDPLYLLKNLAREVRIFFTLDPFKRAELSQRLANERLMELKRTVEERRGEKAIEKGIRSYQREIKRMKKSVESVKENAEQSERVEVFLDKFIRDQVLHQRQIQRLGREVSSETYSEMERAGEEHLETFGYVVNKMEGREERIGGRLEKNLHELEASEFREFKEAEILRDLEQKLPEPAQESVQKVEESTVYRLRTKVEQMPEEKMEAFKQYTQRIYGDKEAHKDILEEVRRGLDHDPELQEEISRQKEMIEEQEKIRVEQGKERGTEACGDAQEPVCGRDGETYTNECFAELAGVEVEHKGECGHGAGGPAPEVFQGERAGSSILRRILERFRGLMYSPGYFRRMETPEEERGSESEAIFPRLETHPVQFETELVPEEGSK